MKKDIFEQAKTTAKETVIFEINDTNREGEYKAGPEYVKAFVSFLESLGFEPTQKYEHSDRVEINGVEFGIGTDNASYMTHQRFTRERSQRKEQNRFVQLERGYGTPSIRVFINVETDGKKLRDRINAAIAERNQKTKAREDYKAEQTRKTIEVGKHYSACLSVRKYVSTIRVDQGNIYFDIDGPGCISISAFGLFHKAEIHFPEMKTVDDLVLYLTKTSQESVIRLREVTEEVLKFPPIPRSLAEWCEGQRHIYFDVKKQSEKQY